MGVDQEELKSGAPEGWSLLDMQDPFLEQNGPLYFADPFEGDDSEPARFGIRIGKHNCSFAGICHGGLIASVLDIALGRSMAKLCDVPHAPTVTLTIDFMRAAKLGDWLESRVRILRRTRSVVFCDAVLVGPEGIVARGSAVFKLLSPRAG
jgi:acyl-coenzyme A thioesterase PaaI-like protein